MQLASRVVPLLRLLDRAATHVRAVAPVVVRVALGHGFALTGLGKLRRFENTVEFFASLGIPFPAANAGFVGSLELVGGLALILGFAVRPFSALLASTLFVALATNDLKEVAATGAPLNVAAVVFLLFTALVFAFGAGPLSLDSYFARRTRAAA